MLPGMKRRISGRLAVPDRPDHGPADAVGLGDDGIVGNIDPFAIDAHPVMSVTGLPIDITDRGAVGIGAARPLPALEAFEPCLQFGIGSANWPRSRAWPIWEAIRAAPPPARSPALPSNAARGGLADFPSRYLSRYLRRYSSCHTQKIIAAYRRRNRSSCSLVSCSSTHRPVQG